MAICKVALSFSAFRNVSRYSVVGVQNLSYIIIVIFLPLIFSVNQKEKARGYEISTSSYIVIYSILIILFIGVSIFVVPTFKITMTAFVRRFHFHLAGAFSALCPDSLLWIFTSLIYSILLPHL